jgi:hypothetical protein
MKLSRLDLLWPYGPNSARKPTQIEVVADLDDDSRWVSSFFDTHNYNQGVKGFRGLGPDQPYRHGNRLVIVAELSEPVIRSAVEGLLASGDFAVAFERLGDVPPEERDGAEV